MTRILEIVSGCECGDDLAWGQWVVDVISVIAIVIVAAIAWGV